MYDPKNAIPQFHPSGNAEMDLRMRASQQQRIHQARRDHRPKNTANTYEGMQQEFLAFCDRNFGLEDPTRHTVTGSKLSQRKKLRLKHGEDPNATLSANKIEIHLAAIVDLWRNQQNKGINSFPHPRIECEQFMDTLASESYMNNDYFQRQLNKETTSDYITENVGSLLKIEKEARITLVLVSKSLYTIPFESRKENKKKRDEYQDRAALTVGDGYTTVEELTALIDYYIAQNSEEGLRNALICLLSHYMYLRGASARQAELADLQSLNLLLKGLHLAVSND
ncbi:hypothetical protein BD408DRAFT_433374 [Parasitella parasitica]|nr:hypothetical protein BD408DRAFT_433374 [Parasitella parasitica]